MLLLVAMHSAYGQTGTPDPSFGNGGYKIVPYNLNGNNLAIFEGWSVIQQPDGKIVTAGTGYDYLPDRYVFAITRHLPNGDLDPSFSGDGIAYIDPLTGLSFDWTYSFARSLAIAPDGKLVITGHSYGATYNSSSGYYTYEYYTPVIRLNSDGTPDNTFDGDGIMLLDLSPVSYWEEGWGVAVQPDKKIVVNATAYSSSIGTGTMTITRLNENGTLDKSFNSSGIVRANFTNNWSQGFGLKLQPDGKIVAAGISYNPSNGTYDFAALRLNADGSHDNSFDGDGKVLVDLGVYDYCYSVDIDPNGKIVLGGTIYNGSNWDFAAVKLNANGSLDNSFDGDGKK